MKEKPPTVKLPFSVYIEGELYETFAYNHQGAISNAAYRYAEDNDEDVKLVMWKIREEMLECWVDDEKER
jgi:hypothetical protein